jgi:hypothetical protein
MRALSFSPPRANKNWNSIAANMNPISRVAMRMPISPSTASTRSGWKHDIAREGDDTDSNKDTNGITIEIKPGPA